MQKLAILFICIKILGCGRNSNMRWVILSPHFDDAVLSCGGLIWEKVRAGEAVEAWTICAGVPEAGEPLSPFAKHLHERWQTGLEAVHTRRVEDENALHRLGAGARYWDLPDCIYRRLPGNEAMPPVWLVNGEDDLWQPIHPLEEGVVTRLSEWLALGLSAGDRLVSPLTLGNHVDHRLVRAAAERAAARTGFALWYYPDYPYAVGPRGDLRGKVGEGWRKTCLAISAEGLRAWQDAVACYHSQISTFWKSRVELDAAIESYNQQAGGICLWGQEMF